MPPEFLVGLAVDLINMTAKPAPKTVDCVAVPKGGRVSGTVRTFSLPYFNLEDIAARDGHR